MSHTFQARGDTVGVVLFQLGGPDSLEAIEPFLYNLFSDPDIIDFPFARLARPVLARLVSRNRAKKVQERYASLGGKSPIRHLTELQAGALERELEKTIDARVFVAMRYWHPLTEETVRQVEAQPLRELVLLPLYPQYSKTTTGSSLREWHRKYSGAANHAPTKIIQEFYNYPLYLDALVEKINQGLARFRNSNSSAAPDGSTAVDEIASGREAPWGGSLGTPASARLKVAAAHGTPGRATPGASTEDVYLVFSAHGVPVSVIEAGDPYQTQVKATVRLVMERGAWPNPHVLCYQSRVAPGRWLEPSLEQTLRDLAARGPAPDGAGRGASKILVVPISFVSDHVETLSEIDIEARRLAGRLGVGQFEVMPALNDSPKFIRALAELVLQQVGAKASRSL